METPVVDLSQEQAPVNTGRLKNYALDEKVRRRIQKEIIPLLQAIRDRRRALSQLWTQLLRVWTLQHDEPTYVGKSNIYVPAGKKATETITSQLVSQTFPTNDNFTVKDGGGKDPVDPTPCQEVLSHQIENDACVRAKAEPFYRTEVITGNSPVKIVWRKKVVKSIRRKGQLGIPESDDTVLYDAPVFQLVDPQNLYFWPENVDDTDECEIVFEDLSVSYSRLRQRAREKIYSMTAVKKLKPNRDLTEKRQADQAKLEAQGISSPQDLMGDHGAFGLVDITEIWLDFDPLAESRDEETNPVPFLITVSGSEILRAIENPIWHKRTPYLLGRMGVLQGRVYGTGLIEGIRELNILLNAQTNQGMDCATLAMNPIMLVNDDLVLGDIGDLEPALQILVSDVNLAVKTITTSTEPINVSSVLTAQTAAWLQDYAMTPPVLSGGSAPGRAFKTATGVGTAQTNAQVPLREIVRSNEKPVWERMLFYFYMLNEQFAEDDYLIYYGAGRQLKKFSRRAVTGNWIFKWDAASQSDNKQLVGSNIVNLMGVLATPGMQQLFQANGLKFNPAVLVKLLVKEVYGFRNVDKIIVDAAMGSAFPQKPGMPPPNVGGNGQPAPQVDPSQLPPGLADNDAFAQMRQSADQLSAHLGIANQGDGDQGYSDQDRGAF